MNIDNCSVIINFLSNEKQGLLRMKYWLLWFSEFLAFLFNLSKIYLFECFKW